MTRLHALGWPAFVVVLSGIGGHASGGAAVDATLGGAPSWLARERAAAERDPDHRPTGDGGEVALGTRTLARVGAAGARIEVPGAGEVTLGLRSHGRRGAMHAAARARPTIAGSEVSIARGGGAREWWRSLPSGLEHGVTLAERSPGAGPLELHVAVGGDLRATSGPADGEVALVTVDHGERRAGYAHLVVLDVDGARVPARMEARGAGIVITVDDARARYPLVVDPLLAVEEAVLSPADALDFDTFGADVALSADGSRALVGGPSDDTPAGAGAGTVRVFSRSGTTWTMEATLAPSDAAAADSCGAAVALSGDASVGVIGCTGDDTAAGSNTGSARVFVHTGTTWAEQRTLLPAGAVATDAIGGSVALSRDGTRALVASESHDLAAGLNAGAVYVFVESGGSWTEEAELTAPDAAANDSFGSDVALSADGSRAAIGVRNDDVGASADVGSVRVFARAGTSWVEEAALVSPLVAASGRLGTAVAISDDGTRVVAGAPNDDVGATGNAGSATVFRRSGTAWSVEARVTIGGGGINENAGSSVALSSDGTRALVGTPRDLALRGSATVFLFSAAAWTEDRQLVGAGTTGALGSAVALSSDGSRALIGAPNDDLGGSSRGAAHVFVLTPAPDGTRCTSTVACASGFCVDGVCCAEACGDGASDCEACSNMLTGGPSGTCAPLTAALAGFVVCRVAASAACDVRELCSTVSRVCPPDIVRPATTLCRASAGVCDPDAESCTGADGVCPPDVRSPIGTECRAAGVRGACDAAETCNGAGATCPADAPLPAASICRAGTGACDAAEVCDGASFTCPGDGLVPAGVVCRSNAGGCDIEETCTGSSAACPGDAVAAAGLVCRPLVSSCDVAESCTGLQPTCPADLFASATTACGPAASDVCDAPDHCSGTSADCVAEFLAGVECRAVAGLCDAPELCGGGSASCPPDVVEAAGMPCRTSTDLLCDAEEICDGVAAACPLDVTTCSDAGRLDAAVADAGAATDAAAPRDAPLVADATPGLDAPGPVATAGCACAVPRASGPAPGSEVVTLLALACLARRRRVR